MQRRIGTLAAAAAVGLVGLASDANAQQTLAQVQERGFLNCQIGESTVGFYSLGSDGTWSGFDVDMCRAVAAAIFGDPDKIEYQSVTNAVRFTSLANGESDMLSRTTTWTAVRDTQLGLEFMPTVFYDGQGFMVPRDSGISSTLELDGATVCVITGTTTELNLADYFRANNMEHTPMTAESADVVAETYLNGACDAITNDKSSLASRRAAFPDPSAHVILPETVSKEPLGPVVRHGDNAWGDLVRWVIVGLIEAEELGVSSENVDEMVESSNPAIRRLLGAEGNIGEELGLDPDFMVDVLKGVGNYGEIYARHLGEGTAIDIPREGTLNAQWYDGGILYAPPFR
ncbi:MAG: amino acid ABC transporter substrate-binding protein [Guyparkeria sp.]